MLDFLVWHDIICVYDKEKNTKRKNRRSKEKKLLDIASII
jgi:hypothetical protein